MMRSTAHPLAGALVLLAAGLGAGCPGEAPGGRDGDGGYAYDSGLALVDGQTDASRVDGVAPSDATKPPPPIKDTGASPAPDQSVAPPPDTGSTTTDGDVGAPCQYNEQCKYGLCAQNTHTGVRFCTKTCDPCAADPCPAGSGCQDAGMAFICAPNYPDAPCQ